MTADYPGVLVEDRAEWRAWLARHHARSTGVWLIRWKKGSGHPHVEYDDVVEEALCFGWVDSQPRRLDEQRSRLLVTPRQPGSNWSRRNKERVARLQAAGLMTASGQVLVDAATADGSWAALDQVENLVEPSDLRAALDRHPAARRYWEAFPPSTRRAILEWIGNAKAAETRARRVAQTVRDAAVDVRANQWRQPKTDRRTPSQDR